MPLISQLGIESNKWSTLQLDYVLYTGITLDNSDLGVAQWTDPTTPTSGDIAFFASILTEIEAYTSLTFSATTSDPSNLARPNVIAVGFGTPPSAGLLGSPDGQAAGPTGDEVEPEAGNIMVSSTLSGASRNYILMHELLHALGMEHPFDTDVAGTPTDYTWGSSIESDIRFSVMNYAMPGNDQAELILREGIQHLQLYDLAHLQALYGVKAYNSQDTVYTYSSGLDQPRAIWDSGGIDAFDLSGHTNGVVLNLGQGQFSGFQSPEESRLTVSIALGAQIENATGTAFSDVVVGNEYSNRLLGGAGDDEMFGDTATLMNYGFIGSQWFLTEPDALNYSYGMRTTPIEGGGPRSDLLDGGEGNDVIIASVGSDSLFGGAGSDALIGGSGDDKLYGDGPGVATGQFGNDFLDGGTDSGGQPGGERDTVVAGVDHTGETTIEIGNATAHQAVFDAAGFHGVSLTGDVVTIIGTGGTDFVRNVETISLVNPGSDSSKDTLVLHAFDAASLGQLRKIDLGLGRDVIDLTDLASGISVRLDQEARYTLTSKGGDGTLIVWNANDIIGTNYVDDLRGTHLKANESRVMTDPLVLDLDGDGIELQGLGRRSPSFDIDGDGVAERTAWVGSDDGLLARDLDGSGAIEGIDELFGQADQSGFASLSALDSNADGVIDAADAAFGTLLVWRDADGDAVADQGELQTLAEAGITSISLTTSAPAVAEIAGNAVTAVSTFTRDNGQTAAIADVTFGYIDSVAVEGGGGGGGGTDCLALDARINLANCANAQRLRVPFQAQSAQMWG